MPKKILQPYVQIETVWYIEILLKDSEQLCSHIQKYRLMWGPVEVIAADEDLRMLVQLEEL